MNCGRNTHSAQRMNPIDVGDPFTFPLQSQQLLDGLLCNLVNFGGPLTFNLVPSQEQSLNLSNTFDYPLQFSFLCNEH